VGQLALGTTTPSRVPSMVEGLRHHPFSLHQETLFWFPFLSRSLFVVFCFSFRVTD